VVGDCSPAAKARRKKQPEDDLRLTAETHPLSVAYEVSCRVRAERAAPPSLEDCTPKKWVPRSPYLGGDLALGMLLVLQPPASVSSD
jgi:hypothetical protein